MAAGQDSAVPSPPPGLLAPHDVHKLVESGLPMVDQLARKYRRILFNQVSFEDLVGYGHVGLVEAANSFDPNRGIPFEPFAYTRVQGAIVDGLRKMCRGRRGYEAFGPELRAAQAITDINEGSMNQTYFSARTGQGAFDWFVETAETMVAAAAMAATQTRSEETHQPAPEDLLSRAQNLATFHSEREEAAPKNPEHWVAQAELVNLVLPMLDELPEEEAMLIRRHYLQGEQLKDIARERNMSRAWTTELHMRGIARLNKRMNLKV